MGMLKTAVMKDEARYLDHIEKSFEALAASVGKMYHPDVCGTLRIHGIVSVIRNGKARGVRVLVWESACEARDVDDELTGLLNDDAHRRTILEHYVMQVSFLAHPPVVWI
jgi:hypothetical protein